MNLPYETLTEIKGENATEWSPEYETTPEFMNGKYNELLANDKALKQQINDLDKRNYILSSADGTTDYDTPTKPSDYKSNAFSVTKLKKYTALGLDASFGYWASIVCIRAHGDSNCHEIAITNKRYILFRTQVGATDEWCEWQPITGHTIDLTAYLLNGWVNYDGGFNTIRASKIGNIVKIEGLIKGGTNTAGTSILQIPTGWRPSKTKICPHWLANGNMGRLDLSSTGILSINGASISNTFLPIDISYII